MQRRDFLKSIGFVVAAPAIVKAENIMKVVAPKTPDVFIGYNQSLEGYYLRGAQSKEDYGQVWVVDSVDYQGAKDEYVLRLSTPTGPIHLAAEDHQNITVSKGGGLGPEVGEYLMIKGLE